MSVSRDTQRGRFLEDAGWGDAEVTPLRPDASFRSYYRLCRGKGNAMLMDAPPPREDIRPFVKVALHLSALGIRVPKIYHCDPVRGFLLLEDLGDDTFTSLLASGAVGERELYRMAVEALLRIHHQPAAAAIDLPPYGAGPLLGEAQLFVHWYAPALRGAPLPAEARESYREAWLEALRVLPPVPPTLVLRDFHVDNLMRTGDPEHPDCAVLDFQDALLGPPAYDLVSLLQDARRDISRELEEEMLDYYFQHLQPPDRETFMRWYRLLGTQRHAKVAGIFVRLCVRDGKCGYLEHLPRVVHLLRQGLEHDELAPVRKWMEEHLPDAGPLPANFDPERARPCCG